MTVVVSVSILNPQSLHGLPSAMPGQRPVRARWPSSLEGLLVQSCRSLEHGGRGVS